MVTAVSYTANYAGDFTNIQTGLDSLGTDFTASSTGNTVGSGSTTTAIQLSTSEAIASFTATVSGTTLTVSGVTGTIVAGQVIQGAGIPANICIMSGAGTTWTVSGLGSFSVTGVSAVSGKNFLGHPLTISGATRLITGYVVSTRIATVSARAGYSAAFAGAPTIGTAYTIDDVSVTLTIGQASAGSNRWDFSALPGLQAPYCTQNITHSLTIQGGTAWNAKCPARYNFAGLTTEPVAIYTNNAGGGDGLGFYYDTHYVTVNDLQICTNCQNPAALGFGGTATVTANRCWFQTYQPYWGCVVSPGPGAGSATIKLYNSFIVGPFSSNGAIGPPCAAFNCALMGYGQTNAASAVYPATGSSATNSAIYGYTTFNGTFTKCASDLSGTGMTVTTPVTSQYAVVNAWSAMYAVAPCFSVGFTDLRPKTGTGLTGIGDGTSITGLATTDLYGVARPTTGTANVTAGPIQTAITAPAVQNVTVSIAYTGADYPQVVFGQVAPSALSSSGTTATLTSATTLPWPIGALVQITTTATTPSGYNVDTFATVTSSTQIQYTVASGLGAVTVMGRWYGQQINTSMGTNLCYLAASSVCGGNAADATHIVLDASVSVECVGHLVTWTQNTTLTTTTCLIVGYDTTTHIAVVSGTVGGIASSFAATPASADTYVIAPVSYTINIGLAGSSNNTLWPIDTWTSVGGPVGGIEIGGSSLYNMITSPTSTYLIQGTTAWDPAQPLGTISGTGSAICLAANTNTPVQPDHMLLLAFYAGNGTLKNLQIWQAINQANPDGCLGAGGLAQTPGQPILFQRCGIRNDFGTDDQDHYPIVGNQASFNACEFDACYLLNTDLRPTAMMISLGSAYTFRNCTIASTQNAITTSSSTVSSGTTITVASSVGIRVPVGSTVIGAYVSHPNISNGANVASLTGSGPYTITLQGGTVTGTVNSGDTILFASTGYAIRPLDSGTLAAYNTAFFGEVSPAGSAFSATFTTCAADSNRSAASGVTTVSYPGSVAAASALLAAGTVDLRLAAASPLIAAGSADATVSTDIYGTPYSTPRTIGCVQYSPVITAWIGLTSQPLITRTQMVPY